MSSNQIRVTGIFMAQPTYQPLHFPYVSQERISGIAFIPNAPSNVGTMFHRVWNLVVENPSQEVYEVDKIIIKIISPTCVLPPNFFENLTTSKSMNCVFNLVLAAITSCISANFPFKKICLQQAKLHNRPATKKCFILFWTLKVQMSFQMPL